MASAPAAGSPGPVPARRTTLADLDVVFLVWREEPRMLERLHTATAQALPDGWSGTALIVENAPPAATSRAARALVARHYPLARRSVLRLPRNMGFARAMNLALAELRGRYALLLNSDGRPAPGLAETLAAALDDHPDAVWAAPAVREGHDYPATTGGARRAAPAGTVRDVDELSGMALLVRREAFLALGGFDPLFFFYNEDFDASRRIRRAGGRLLRVDSATFAHDKHGRSTGGQALRELHFAWTDIALVHAHASSAREAVRRIATSKPRAVFEHLRHGDIAGAAALTAALVAWPVAGALGARRRRRRWDGARLERWLAAQRPRVRRIELGPEPAA